MTKRYRTSELRTLSHASLIWSGEMSSLVAC